MFNFDISMTLGPGQEMTLTLINHIPSLVVCFCQLSGRRLLSEISIVFTFSHAQAYVSIIDLALKLVQVILGPSLEQTTISWSPRYDIPSFVKIGLPVLEKKIFEHL